MARHAIACVILLLASCRGSAPIQKEEAFHSAVEAKVEESPARAASGAWAFLSAADPDDSRYDRALLLLGQSLEELDLNWAAGMVYRDIAHARRNMELLPQALRGLERVVDTGVYDEDLLVTGFLSAEEFGWIPDEVQAFVDYHRGVDLARRGSDEWADAVFARLPPDSPYAARAEYVRAVRFVAAGEDAEAVATLEGLSGRYDLPSDLAQDVERSLARLAFEEQRFEDALSHFKTLRGQAPDDPEILLETAWTQFYLGDSRKTLGLLIALDAPVHQHYISPERYLLEALALRRLCQFGAAREAAVRLRRKHGGSLDALAEGKLPVEVPELHTAARLRGRSGRNARFTDRLEWERGRLAALRLDDDLRAHLDDLYDRGLVEAQRRERAEIGRDVDGLAEELLGAEEGVRLIIHELGVSLLRGRRRPPGVAEKPGVEVPLSGARVFYPFTGEYWTDEMDDLVVVAEDRCVD